MTIATPYRCPRCIAAPRPSTFANERRCAFTADGTFTPDNWRCGTLDALIGPSAPVQPGAGATVNGRDESLDVVMAHPDDGGWFIFGRYKRRGCTDFARHVVRGETMADRQALEQAEDHVGPVTLALVERAIACHRGAR